MKKATLMAFLIAALAPMMQALAGGSSTTYYAALKAQVSSDSSGMGKVYAGTSNSAGTYATPSSQSSNQSSTTQNEEKTFYAFAQANDGYEFLGWSTTENGTTYASTASPYSVKVKCSSSTESSPTLTTVYANFKKKMLAAFGITFETSSAGTYTVDGVAPVNKTGLTEATSVTLASADPNFLNWVVNGLVVSANPYTASYMANTTISAQFLTADQVTSVVTYDDLTSALSNAQYKKITIPSGTTINVAKSATVTVPSGKQLVVDGTLVVLGTISNSGAISGRGTLYKISYTIDQGEDELQILYAPDGSEYGKISNTTYHSGESSRYYKTKVSSNTPSVNGTVSVSTTSWGILLNGENVYAISAQTLKGVQVSLDTSVAANKITGIVGSLTTTDISSGETSGKKNWLLFADCNLKGPVRSDATTRLNFNGTIDLGGHKLTFGQPRTYSDFYGMFLNGTISFTPSTDFQNGGSIFFNCSSINITKIKGTPTMLFYDCGATASAASLSFNYQSGAHRNARFYGGCYSYTFNSSYDNSYAKVYGGSFSTDPSSYLADIDTLEAVKSGNYYVVQKKKSAVNVVQIGSTPYPTLDAAISAAANGSTISLIEAVELTGTTTVPAGKNITIALDGHGMTGGKIVNNGTLLFTDSTTGKGTSVSEASGGSVASDIENNGTLDFIFGTYSGSIVNKTGTLTTHNGLFSGTLTKNGGTVNLKGGHFSTNVEELATVENTKVFVRNNFYSVCELPNGAMYSETLSGVSGYGVTPYSDEDFALVNGWFGNKNTRADYTSAEWIRLAELLCFYQLFNNNGLDATLAFDRDVAMGSLNLYAKSKLTLSIDLKFDLAAGQYYRALSETLIGNGYYSKTYKALWDDNIKSVAMAASDKSGDNAGTVCTAMIELWESQKVGSTGRVTNTVFIAAQKRFTIGAGSNVAMIRPEVGSATFYATLDAAVNAVADGGTVMLAKDCDDTLNLPKAGTYTFDTMGFAYTGGNPTVATGLTISSTETNGSATTYVVAPVQITVNVTGTGTSSIYNGAEQIVPVAYTFTCDNELFSADKVLVSDVHSVSGKVVGEYPYGLQASWFSYDDDNIVAAFVVESDAALTITRKDAIVKAGNVSKMKGAADPSLVTITGVVGSDRLLYSVSRESGEDEGVYQITVSGESEQGNYSVAFENGKLTIVNPVAIKEEIAEELQAEDTNGNAKWENLVIGQRADESAAVTAANGGTETMAKIEVSFEVPTDAETGDKIDTGYTVRYAFDKVDSTSGEVVEDGKGDAQEEPTLDFEDVAVNEPTYFKMRAVLESNDDPEVKSEVEVEKTIGVLKVESDAEYTILAVPWQSLGSGDIKASELVHAASLSEDDELIVYNDDGSTTSWVVKNGEWTSPTEYTIGDGPAQQNETVDPSTKEIARGQGVWLKRNDTNKDIVLIGQPATDDVETPIAAATEEEPSWNLVASPKMVEVDISAAFTEEKGNTGDEIIVPTAGTPKHYTYKDDSWGYTAVVEQKEVRLPNGEKTISVKFGRKTDDTKVPAGQGFWYLNKGSSDDKKITW